MSKLKGFYHQKFGQRWLIISLHSFCSLIFSLHCLCWSTSYLFISRLRPVYWSTLKIANDLPIFASYYAFVIVIVTLTWLAYFCHVIISLILIHSAFYLFSVSLWRRANARNVRLYYPYWQYTDLFIFLGVSIDVCEMWSPLLVYVVLRKTVGGSD